MLTHRQKYCLFLIMYKIIIHSQEGIDTRVLVKKAIDALSTTVANLNYHHAYGMLSYLLRSRGVYFVVRSPGLSIVAI